MNDRITLLQREAGASTTGRPSTNWVDVATIWANVKFQTGAEVIRANAETSVVRVSIRIRARADVDAAWRVRYQKATYDVKAVLPDSMDRRFAFLVCETAK